MIHTNLLISYELLGNTKVVRSYLIVTKCHCTEANVGHFKTRSSEKIITHFSHCICFINSLINSIASRSYIIAFTMWRGRAVEVIRSSIVLCCYVVTQSVIRIYTHKNDDVLEDSVEDIYI